MFIGIPQRTIGSNSIMMYTSTKCMACLKTPSQSTIGSNLIMMVPERSLLLQNAWLVQRLLRKFDERICAKKNWFMLCSYCKDMCDATLD